MSDCLGIGGVTQGAAAAYGAYTQAQTAQNNLNAQIARQNLIQSYMNQMLQPQQSPYSQGIINFLNTSKGPPGQPTGGAPNIPVPSAQVGVAGSITQPVIQQQPTLPPQTTGNTPPPTTRVTSGQPGTTPPTSYPPNVGGNGGISGNPYVPGQTAYGEPVTAAGQIASGDPIIQQLLGLSPTDQQNTFGFQLSNNPSAWTQVGVANAQGVVIDKNGNAVAMAPPGQSVFSYTDPSSGHTQLLDQNWYNQYTGGTQASGGTGTPTIGYNVPANANVTTQPTAVQSNPVLASQAATQQVGGGAIPAPTGAAPAQTAAQQAAMGGPSALVVTDTPGGNGTGGGVNPNAPGSDGSTGGGGGGNQGGGSGNPNSYGGITGLNPFTGQSNTNPDQPGGPTTAQGGALPLTPSVNMGSIPGMYTYQAQNPFTYNAAMFGQIPLGAATQVPSINVPTGGPQSTGGGLPGAGPFQGGNVQLAGQQAAPQTLSLTGSGAPFQLGPTGTQGQNAGQDALMQAQAGGPGTPSMIPGQVSTQSAGSIGGTPNYIAQLTPGLGEYDNSALFGATTDLSNLNLAQNLSNLYGSAGSLGARFGTAMNQNAALAIANASANLNQQNQQIASTSYENAQQRALQAQMANMNATNQMGQFNAAAGQTMSAQNAQQGNIYNNLMLGGLNQAANLQQSQTGSNTSLLGLLAGLSVPQAQASPYPSALGSIGSIATLYPFLSQLSNDGSSANVVSSVPSQNYSLSGSNSLSGYAGSTGGLGAGVP